MISVSYKSILDGLAASLGQPSLQAEEAAMANTLFSLRYRMAHEYYWWPDLMAIERRTFRPIYASGATYAAGDVVYFILTDSYYQALRTTTGNDPATGSSPVLNAAYWAAAQGEYSADNYSASVNYAVGQLAFYPTNGNFYQAFIANVGVLPTDATKWGLVNIFKRTIDLAQPLESVIGTVRRITAADPDIYNAQPQIPFRHQGSAILVKGGANRPYVEFRVPVPTFSGPNWAAGSYAVGDQVYYSVTGDFYACIAPATTQPPTSAVQWERLLIPADFKNFLIETIKADFKGDVDGQEDKEAMESMAGFTYLLAEIQRYERQQGQTKQMRVVSSRN